ncbi:ATP-dependent RNA helicase ddx54 [Irineochytrium annulatum]|nr:ATP-dependent RNA helicase ddx54 [Irineochytrium annulatum]
MATPNALPPAISYFDEKTYKETADFLRAKLPEKLKTLEVGIICGSGLGGLAETLEEPRFEIAYKDIPNFAVSTVPGHVGKLVFGLISGKAAVCMVGRKHAYEGHTLLRTVFPIRVFSLLKIHTLVVTNAAGGLNPSWSIGDIMIIQDHLNLPGIAGLSALVGPNLDCFGTRFPPVSDAYDFDLRCKVVEAAAGTPLEKVLREGTYCFVAGPSFESRTEARLLRSAGGDCVGMSTVPEVIVARHAGVRVVGLSLVTNMVNQSLPRSAMAHVKGTEAAAGGNTDSGIIANHEEVLATSAMRSQEMQGLVRKLTCEEEEVEGADPAARDQAAAVGEEALGGVAAVEAVAEADEDGVPLGAEARAPRASTDRPRYEDFQHKEVNKGGAKGQSNRPKARDDRGKVLKPGRGNRDDEGDEGEAGSGSEASEGFETVPVDEEDGEDAQGSEVGGEGIEDNEVDSEGEDVEDAVITKSVHEANKRHKKSGGFQSMGLSFPVYGAIIKKGYKLPTPIQRKAIPVIMENKDVVAMARTGSGKTAAFIIPLLERLKTHSPKFGARGLIMTPSRELAMQTLKFVKELAKNMDLRACMLVGGDIMDDQFSALASNPDIIVATPGRLMHLIIEMNLDLRSVEYVVFDEADRLFEMGFAEQLKEILYKLPESRQTLLFSATLPKQLVEFAKAGLSDPALIRLDVDTKLSPDLQMLFFLLKAEDKDAALIHLLDVIIPKDQQTLIFAATKHLVEYLHELLTLAGIANTYIYGSLDQQARNMHIARFRSGGVKVMLVTDIAARGIDIPLLDNVIHFDFPASPKVMIHRSGRVARAGRTGMAFSLVVNDELPFLLDLQLFLGRSLMFGSAFDASTARLASYTTDIILGQFPPSSLHIERERVLEWLKENASLLALQQSVKNGYKLYYKTRATASKESYARAKEVIDSFLGINPYLLQFSSSNEVERINVLDQLANFRPSETVFEIGRRGMKTSEAVLMSNRRRQLSGAIEAKRALRSDLRKGESSQKFTLGGHFTNADDDDFNDAFTDVITGTSKKRKRDGASSSRDAEFYMSHFQKDSATEKGYSVNAKRSETTGTTDNFAERAAEITVDVAGDDEDGLKVTKTRGNLLWDKKKKSFVRQTAGADNKKRIKTDSGASVPASFKSNRFESWQKKTRVSIPRVGDEEIASAMLGASGKPFGQRTYRHNKITPADPKSKNFARKQAMEEKKARVEGKSGKVRKMSSTPAAGQSKSASAPKSKGKSELKTSTQIAKERRLKEKRREKTGRHKKSKK